MVTRAEIEAAKKNIAEAKSQIEESKSQIQSSQQNVAQELRDLVPKKRVPFTPRKTRYAIQKYKQQLGKTGSELRAAQQKLSTQEADIISYESQVLKADKELTEYEQRKASLKEAQRAFDRGLSLKSDFTNPYTRSYLRKMYQQKDLAEEAFRRQVEDFQAANPTEKLLVDWSNLKIAGVESGALGQSLSFDNYNKRIAEINQQFANSGYQFYDKALEGLYDPTTGKEVLQSIAPDLAAQKGLIPIRVEGFNPETGKYLIKSDTGLLTPQQQAYGELMAQFSGKKLEVPQTFEIGGAPQKVDVLDILGGQKSPYQLAAMSRPYPELQQRKVDYYNLNLNQQYKKYGGELTPEGDVIRLGSGAASAVINIGPTRKEGESLFDWYKRNISSKEQTKSAFDLAFLITGARAAKAALSAPKVIGSKASKQALFSLGSAFSEPISYGRAAAIDALIAPSPTGFKISGAPKQVARGLIFAAVSSNPLVAGAAIRQLTQASVSDPVGTGKQLVDYVKKNPYEFGTIMAIGVYKGRQYRLNQKSVKMIQKNIEQLNKAKLQEVSVITKGAGRRPGSARIEIVGYQVAKDSIRKIRIEGDLLVQKGGKMYFMPDARGYATTVTFAKPSRFAQPRIYQDAQYFKVGAKSSGINIGQIGEIGVFTPFGKTVYDPLQQSYALVTKKFGPFANSRLLNQIAKTLETPSSYGGTTVVEYKLPYQDLGFKFNDQVSLLVGDKAMGAVFTVKQAPKSYGGRILGGKKTPYPTEQAAQAAQQQAQALFPLESISAKVGAQTQNIVSQIVPVAKTPPLIGIPRMVGGEGLTEEQLAKYAGPSAFMVNYQEPLARNRINQQQSPATMTELMVGTQSVVSQQTVQKQKQLQETTQQQRQELQQKIELRQKQLQKQQQLVKQRQAQKQQQVMENIFGPPSPIAVEFGFGVPNFMVEEGARRAAARKSKKKKKERKVLPTLTQQLVGIRRRTPLKRSTGFEIARI